MDITIPTRQLGTFVDEASNPKFNNRTDIDFMLNGGAFRYSEHVHGG